MIDFDKLELSDIELLTSNELEEVKSVLSYKNALLAEREIDLLYAAESAMESEDTVIGNTARAMFNFGLTKFRFLSPVGLDEVISATAANEDYGDYDEGY